MRSAWPFSSEGDTRAVAEGAWRAARLTSLTAAAVLVNLGLLRLRTPDQGDWPAASLLALGLTLAVIGSVLGTANGWRRVVGGLVLLAAGPQLLGTADFVWLSGSVLLVVGVIGLARRTRRVKASGRS